MIKTFGALNELRKLGTRIEKIVGKKRLDSFINKRKGLGKSKGHKIVQYTMDKPSSAKRRIARIHKGLDAAPYVATGGATLTVASMLSSNKNNNKG
tara:strand:- start:480 stop:767 length:288 start_codon:yes stop_codon:yes gene_type:complete